MAKKIEGTIAADNLKEAKKEVAKLKTLGYKNIRISKIDARSLAYRHGSRYWVSYIIPNVKG